jgi:hypothetical protein
MVSVGVLRAEGCDETVDLGLIGGGELGVKRGPGEGREQLEACASKFPYGRQMDHPVRPQALEQPVQQSRTDVVQDREHGHSPEGDAVELGGLVRSLGMSSELPALVGPPRTTTTRPDSTPTSAWRPILNAFRVQTSDEQSELMGWEGAFSRRTLVAGGRGRRAAGVLGLPLGGTSRASSYS